MRNREFVEESEYLAISEEELQKVEKSKEFVNVKVEIDGDEKEEVLDALYDVDGLKSKVYRNRYGYFTCFYIIENNQLYMLW